MRVRLLAPVFLLLALVYNSQAITITQWAAGSTILVNTLELPATWKKTKAVVKGTPGAVKRTVGKVFHRKPKQAVDPVDCLTTQPAGTPCPIEKGKSK